MHKSLIALVSLVALQGAAMLAAPAALAQSGDYPNRPVKVVVPFPTGSSIDLTGRFFADQLASTLGQPFVVENRAGANGAIGVSFVKTQPADGYTIMIGSNSSLSVNPFVVKNLPYDAVKDLKPISGLTRLQAMLVVAEGGKYRTIADLIGAARQRELTVGTFAAGYQLAQAWLSTEANVKWRHVPYKAVTQVLTDIIGGQVDFTIVDAVSAVSLIQAGKMRALGVLGSGRHVDFPNVPTFAESGYPNYVTYLWNGYFVRADLPDALTNRLADAMAKIMQGAPAHDFVRKAGLELLPLGPAAMRKYHLDDLARWQKVADTAGIKPE